MKVTMQAPPGPIPGEAETEDRPGPPPGSRGVTPGTFQRVLPYARPYGWKLLALGLASAVGAAITAANPILFGAVIDDGIAKNRTGTVLGISAVIIGLALLTAVVQLLQAKLSAQIGEGLVYDLRTRVFVHVQAQPVAFFTRAQTGSLVSRLNTDIVGAQQAVTVLMSESLSTLLTLGLVVGAMFFLSWQLSLLALVSVPFFLLPGRIIGRRMQRQARRGMELNAEMGSLMNERFNVAGAILTKLYGRPREESEAFNSRARDVRDVGVRINVTGQLLGILMGLTGTITLGLMFGLGGELVIHHMIQIGTLIALITLVGRLYVPFQQLSQIQASAMSALVSFDRVFEILDLQAIVADGPSSVPLPAGRAEAGRACAIEFDRVSFRYPTATEVSLASLESHTFSAAGPERAAEGLVLDEVSFRAPAGTLTALVGRSGAGKTTIINLLPRFYDPLSGAVRIDGMDLRGATLQSVRDTVGVVTQEAHLFHDTIRANLLYARPEASERELIEACEAAQIWTHINALPDGLDTVVGDRGHRLSGGEKQRVALARLLLKAPPVVVLDEATAHLDSESEAAIQRALQTALAGRTSVVIAHRLSTVRDADQILVVDRGRIVERGTHESLLAGDGLYKDLYTTQFAPQEAATRAAGLI